MIFLIAIALFNFLHAQEITVQEKLYHHELALDPTPVNPKDIPYRLYGNAKNPTLVLIHGLGGNKDTWNHIVNDLSKSYQVLTYDQRGHGENPIEGENFSSATMAHDLLLLLDNLNIKKVNLLGHSMGGRTAVRFASQYPDRIESVTVEDMHMKGRSKLLDNNLELSRYLKKIYRPIYQSAQEVFNLYAPIWGWKHIEEVFFFARKSPKNGTFKLYQRAHVNVLYSQQGLQEDLTDALKSVTAHIHFLAATHEPVLFGVGVEHIQQNKPEAKITYIQDADHNIHSSQPMLFLKALNSLSCSLLF